MEEQRDKYLLDVYNTLGEMFPDAGCELNYNNVFELLIAVVLSAQTTDKRVNMVTPILFSKYNNSYELEKANYNDVLEIIKSLGLAKTKAKNIISLAASLNEKYNGIVPNTLDELVNLPGVGRKTANVILSVGFNLPGLAVDTHVSRVSNRLGLVNTDDVLKIEKELKEMYDETMWGNIHHRLLFFGRYKCKAIKPDCMNCPFEKTCVYNKSTL